MVAKSPTSTNRVKTLSDPIRPKEIVQKVERCMARLQELQLTVTKINSPLKLSPCRNRVYQESLRKKSVTSQRSVAFQKNKIPLLSPSIAVQNWRTMSLWNMLLSETVAEIMQKSKFVSMDPRTPETVCRRRNPPSGNTELRTRRANEKKLLSRIRRSESGSPRLPGARTRIKFKPTSPLCKKNATNISMPKTRPWTKKTVLFPNPLFLPTSKISQAPHKFLIKSPRATTLGSQFKNKKAVTNVTVTTPMKGNGNGFVSKPRRCSFSPSKFANRLISPLKSRLSLHRHGSGSAIKV